MKIEMLKGSDIGKTRRLYEEVFHDSIEYTDYFYQKVQRKGTAFAAEEHNKVIAELFLLPKRLVYNDKIVEAFYVYGVATKKEYRGQGCMSSLIKEALCYAKDTSAELLYLIPVNPALYGRYGFHIVKQGEIRIWELSERERTERMKSHFELISEIDDIICQEINTLETLISKSYDKNEFSIYPLRDREYLSDRIFRAKIEGGKMYLIKEQYGKAAGLIITGKEKGELVVMDVIAECTKKEKILKNFMKWQGIEKIKEYIFTIMIKELSEKWKEPLKNKIWVTLNDEI